MTTTKLSIPTPTAANVKAYIKRWNGLEDYVDQEKALNLLFYTLVPENKQMEHILLKISVLNDFYSTNIFDVHSVAKHFLTIDIDKRLRANDPTLVDDLSHVTIKGKPKHFYSFATKYCSHHHPNNYPIYDNYVSKTLLYFGKKDKFAIFKEDDLKTFAKFKSIIAAFQKYYKLEQFTVKEIDQYLWQLGKEYFPRNYKPNKS